MSQGSPLFTRGTFKILTQSYSLHESKLNILHTKNTIINTKKNAVPPTSSSSPLPFYGEVRGLPNLFPIGLVAPDLIKKSLLTNLPIDLTFGLFYLG